jgi:hypothetical protein
MIMLFHLPAPDVQNKPNAASTLRLQIIDLALNISKKPAAIIIITYFC